MLYVCYVIVCQKQRPKRVKAIYNCVADNPDELTFSEGEVIVVDGEEDQEWWVSIPDAALFEYLQHVVRGKHTKPFPVQVMPPLWSHGCRRTLLPRQPKQKSHDLTLVNIPLKPLFPPTAASSVHPLV